MKATPLFVTLTLLFAASTCEAQNAPEAKKASEAQRYFPLLTGRALQHYNNTVFGRKDRRIDAIVIPDRTDEKNGDQHIFVGADKGKGKFVRGANYFKVDQKGVCWQSTDGGKTWNSMVMEWAEPVFCYKDEDVVVPDASADDDIGSQPWVSKIDVPKGFRVVPTLNEPRKGDNVLMHARVASADGTVEFEVLAVNARELATDHEARRLIPSVGKGKLDGPTVIYRKSEQAGGIEFESMGVEWLGAGSGVSRRLLKQKKNPSGPGA